MKKTLSKIMVAALLLTGISAFADTGVNGNALPMTSVAAVPALYENTSPKFELRQAEDNFTVILNENVTTGYSWAYTVQDSKKVVFENDSQLSSSSGLPGAGGSHEFSFKATEDGVSTIAFDYQRPWEPGSVDTLNIVVTKNGKSVTIVENRGIASLSVNEEKIVSDAASQVINGVTMLPLRSTLEKLGYEVTWNGEKRTVEIGSGAQWTSITIGQNAYFKNKMAPAPLSAAPVIVNGRTLVPAEFFSAIVDKGLQIENGNIKFSASDAVIQSGYVKSISSDDKGTIRITLTSDYASDDIMLQTVIIASGSTTLFNKSMAEGDYINVVSSMIMTLSIPGQTAGYIVY